MSVKKDPSGRRSVELQVELPGSPEEVWEVMATGPGISSWFIPTEVEERAGGAIKFEFGPGLTSTGEVTEWQPPRRLAYLEKEWLEGAPAVATEVVVEARDGGSCVVRMVHSLFATDDEWDDQLAGFESGWQSFFHVLRLRMAHHRGQPSSTIQFVGLLEASEEEVWNRLLGQLGLEGAAEGTEWRSPEGPPPLAGVVGGSVSDPQARYLFLRLDEPAPGAATLTSSAWEGKVHLGLNLYLYGATAEQEARRHRPRWQAWMKEHFESSAELGGEQS